VAARCGNCGTRWAGDKVITPRSTKSRPKTEPPEGNGASEPGQTPPAATRKIGAPRRPAAAPKKKRFWERIEW
jgi:hypothetical protein